MTLIPLMHRNRESRHFVKQLQPSLKKCVKLKVPGYLAKPRFAREYLDEIARSRLGAWA